MILNQASSRWDFKIFLYCNKMFPMVLPWKKEGKKKSPGRKLIIEHSLAWRCTPTFCAGFPFFSLSMWKNSLWRIWRIYKQNKEHECISLLNAFRNQTDQEGETWFVHHHTLCLFLLCIPISSIRLSLLLLFSEIISEENGRIVPGS